MSNACTGRPPGGTIVYRGVQIINLFTFCQFNIPEAGYSIAIRVVTFQTNVQYYHRVSRQVMDWELVPSTSDLSNIIFWFKHPKCVITAPLGRVWLSYQR